MKEIIDLLVKNGYEAYIVGGYVRDYLLGIKSNDVDICTNASIDEIIYLFKDRGKPYKEYYSYHMIENNISFNITSYRIELKYKKNKPTKITLAKDLKTDLKRRDFTINTLAIDHNGKLIDLMNSINDINSKIIKTVGDTNKKFIEDKTRIIRAIRFACTLDFDLSSDILNFLLSNNAHLINQVPKEYKKNELDKIFDSENYNKFFFYIKRYNLKDYFNIKSYSNIKKVYNRYGIWAQIDTDLPFSNEEKKIINNIKKLIEKNDIYLSDITTYDDDVICNAAAILNIEDKVKEIKKFNGLNSIIDIDLSLDLMLRYINIKDLKKVYKLIERKIIEGSLENNSYSIEMFLRKL